MTEPGTPERPVSGPQESTGGSAAESLPTRRELRAQREAAANAPTEKSSDVVPVRRVPAAAAPQVPVGPTPPAASAKPQPTSPKQLGATAPNTHPASMKPARKKKSLLSGVLTLAVVPGLFLTVALPAYAFAPGTGETQFAESSSHLVAEKDSQGVDVPSVAANVTVARDGYTAVSGAEIREKVAQAEAAARAQAAAEKSAAAGAYSAPGPRQEGDDYPWPGGSVGSLSPLNYEYRECVDFVAWRLNRDLGATSPFRWVWSNLTPGGGSAWEWPDAWYSHGWQVSHAPIVGAVAWFTYNHVAYVQSVNSDGTVTIEEYNQNSDHNYHRRTIPVGGADLYLYPPPT